MLNKETKSLAPVDVFVASTVSVFVCCKEIVRSLITVSVWTMQDGTPWPGNNVRDHPGMIQVVISLLFALV